MATLSIDALESAFSRGKIDGKTFTEDESQQICTMNALLCLIQNIPGISSFALRKAIRLNHCTVLIYCRWLESKELIKVTHKGQGGVCFYVAAVAGKTAKTERR